MAPVLMTGGVLLLLATEGLAFSPSAPPLLSPSSKFTTRQPLSPSAPQSFTPFSHAAKGLSPSAPQPLRMAGAEVAEGLAAEGLKRQVSLFWELENSIKSTDFQQAAQLSQQLKEIRGEGEEELLPVGKRGLSGRKVLVAGANGRTGSSVVRQLLRRGATVHAVVRNTDDQMSYERLSYEIGAEDGIGQIQAPWISKSVSMIATEAMSEYGLANLKVFECELLDAKRVEQAVKGVDAVIFCATDFDGGRPRIDLPEVFTAEALFSVTDKLFLESARQKQKARDESAERKAEGLVDIEAVEILAKAFLKQRRLSAMAGSGPVPSRETKKAEILEFVLLSACDGSLPFDQLVPGSVEAIKRKGEAALWGSELKNKCVLRLAQFDDRVETEGLRPQLAAVRGLEALGSKGIEAEQEGQTKKCINRRDAAQLAVLSLISGQSGTLEAWTVEK